MTDLSNAPRADINHFELLGYVGRLRAAETPSGREVANLSVATHRLVREPETRRLVERTEWHDLVAFDEVASRVRQEARKGTRIRVIGYMRTRRWVDNKTNENQFKRELVATELEVLGQTPPPTAEDIELRDADTRRIKISSF